MSGEVVGWAMKQLTGSPAAKLVLAKLADNANEQGLCWPSIDLIVEHTELAQSTVYKHLAKLEELGLIKSTEITVRGEPVKGFQLTVPGFEEKIPPRRKTKDAVLPGGIVSPPHGNSALPGGILYKEEPSLEPSVNRHPSPEEAVDDVRLPSREEREAIAIASWPPIWKAYMDLPGMANAPVTESEARDAWVRVGLDDAPPPEERPTGPEMVDCIAEYGRWLAAVNATRPKDRPQMTQFPQNWMRERKFVPYLAKVRAAAAVARKAPKSGVLIDREFIDALLAAGTPPIELEAWFRGVVLHRGPPFRLECPYGVVAERFATAVWRARLVKVFGHDVEVVAMRKAS
ncbi:MAG: helix-turn-helix domain-containing protein [Rhizomicrobium sp.]